MNKIYFISALCVYITISSCSKKTYPNPTVPVLSGKNDSVVIVKRMDSVVTPKPVVKRKVKEPVPAVITVNDKFAKKSVDGRFYYDLQGKRYWRNNKDGKYYLFNKSMQNDDSFKSPGTN